MLISIQLQAWNRSADLVIALIKDVIYGTSLDSTMKTAVKARRTVEEMLGYTALEERLTAISNAFENEAREAGGGDEPEASVARESSGAGRDSTGNASALSSGCDNDEAATENGDEMWNKLAERTVASYVELIAEPESEAKLTEILLKAGAKSVVGHSGLDHVAIMLDPKTMGEPITAPHLRCTPLGKNQKKRVIKIISAIVKSRSPDGCGAVEGLTLADGDVILTLDGGRPGLVGKVAALTRGIVGKLQRKYVTICLDEKALAKRKSRVRGVASLNQTETLCLLASQSFNVPETDRKYYQGTNRGSALAWVQLTPWESGDTWKESFQVKKQYYGKTRVAVGGKSTEGDKKSGSEDEEEDELDSEVVVPPAVDSSGNLFMPKNRNNCNLEPVCFWSMPVLFYKELVSSYNLQALYDVNAADGGAAKACIALRRPNPGCFHSRFWARKGP